MKQFWKRVALAVALFAGAPSAPAQTVVSTPKQQAFGVNRATGQICAYLINGQCFELGVMDQASGAFVVGLTHIPVLDASHLAANAVTNAKAAQMPAFTVKSNISSSVANPADNSLSSILDATLGSTSGSILERGSSGWQTIAPGASGYVWTSNGPGLDPTWQAASGTYVQSGTGGQTATVQNVLQQYVSIKNFGAKCDGTTDDTTAIQNAWNYGQSIKKNVWLSGVGTGVCKFTSLTMPMPGSGNGGQSVLVGDGPQSVTLLSSVTGSNCAITLNATYGSTGSFLGIMRGFTLSSANAVGSNAGRGICLSNITDFSLSNFSIIGPFNQSIYAADSIWINVDHCQMYGANYGVYADYTTNTRPNNWNIGPGCLFHDNIQGPIYMHNPGTINIFGNNFEHNGIGSTGNLWGAVFVDGDPEDGTKGVSFYGNYVENNFGSFDLTFVGQAGQTYSGAHEVYGNTFNRLTSSNVTDNIYINNASASGITSVSVHDNGFNELFTPSGSMHNINVANPTTYGTYQLTCNGNTVANPSTQMAKVPCQPKKTTAPGWLLMDGFYYQFGTVTATTAGAAVTFPVACPNGVVSVNMTVNNGSSSSYVSTGAITNSGFTAYGNGSVGAAWTAVCH